MSSQPPRIAYFGLPLGALALLRAGFVPELVVLEHTDAPGARRLRHALRGRSPIVEKPDPASRELLAALQAAAPDVILSWFYPKRIPPLVLALPARGAFGVHPSLLPRWRGPDPYYWTILAGDTHTGVSLHRLESEYDTGAIVAQKSLAIEPTDNAWRLAKRLDRPGLELLLACAARLHAGERLEGVPQDPRLATLAPAPSDDELSLDWSRPSAELVRRIRAAAPDPGASAELGLEWVEILAAHVAARELPRALAPADAVLTPEGLAVCTGDGAVVVERARDERGHTLRGDALLRLFPEGLARVGFATGPRGA